MLRGQSPKGGRDPVAPIKEECSNGDRRKLCPQEGCLKSSLENCPQIRPGSHLNHYLSSALDPQYLSSYAKLQLH